MSSIARKRILVVVGGVVLLGGALVLSAPRTICHYSGARWVKARADIYAIEDAIERYRVDRGAAPTSIEKLSIAESNQSPYLEYLPIDPWGHAYKLTSDGKQYLIVSLGADGAPVGKTRMPTSQTTPHGKIGPNRCTRRAEAARG